MSLFVLATTGTQLGWMCVGLTVLFTVFGQLVLKWQLRDAALPEAARDKVLFLFGQFLNPWILAGFASAFLAALAWMVAMTKLSLSQAYPFMSLSIVIVMLASAVLLREPFTLRKVLGTGLVMIGLIVLTSGR